MLAVAKLLVAPSAAARTFINFYSTVSGLSQRDWRTPNHPAPRSLVQEEHDDVQAEDDRDPELPAHRPLHRKPSKIPTPHAFRAHRATLKNAFPQGWAPPRKLSREAMDGLRSMHALDPESFTTPVLADRFRISPEAVRRILRSKWEPSSEQRARLLEKERRSRAKWIEERRVKERRVQREYERGSGQVVGRHRKDKLSLT